MNVLRLRGSVLPRRDLHGLLPLAGGACILLGAAVCGPPDGSPQLRWQIWGRSPTEIYAVGARGAVLLFDGSTWTSVASPTQRTLFGVYGNEQLVVACGGAQSGVIIENAAASFDDVTPQATQRRSLRNCRTDHGGPRIHWLIESDGQEVAT